MSISVKALAGAGEVGKELIKQTGELVKEPVTNIVNPPTKTLGERLGDIVDLILTPVELAKIYKDNAVGKFRDKLAKKVSDIPEGKRVTPPLNIVGPAVEAAKYHIENEELREMFANLIAGSMNKDKNSLAHPSFIEVIKQLSPLDAVNIAAFRNMPLSPVVDYVIDSSSGKGQGVQIVILSNVALGLGSTKDIYSISSSITNLIRLGLLESTRETIMGEYEEYQAEDVLIQARYLVGIRNANHEGIVQFKRGTIQTTSFGKRFIAICTPKEDATAEQEGQVRI